MPFLIMEPDLVPLFWASGWPLVLVLVLALCALNVFYFSKRRLYYLLEREDWPALQDYLEQQVISRRHYTPRMVQLLANTYLVMSDSAGVMALENKTAVAKPALIESNALVFGAARILGGDTAGAANFFSLRLKNGKTKDPQWIRWYYGFSLLLNRQFEQAAVEFKALATESSDALITGLSSYFLWDTLRKYTENGKECRDKAREGRNRVQQVVKTADEWNREAGKIETEVYAAVIKQYIAKAGIWLFGRSA
ncbi:MAG: hypothetical protein LBG10_02755 [Treponema sp.]|jgi:hypothetical protein|nr:hypothetical protein [Treponema sp.]